MSTAVINESLAERLNKAEVYDEFCALMFDQRMHYDELLEQLEKWGISSSLGALSRFKGSHRGHWALERAKREEKEFLSTHGAELDETTRKLIAMRIFQDAASPETSTKDVLRMRDQELQMAKLKQDAVKLEQAERKLSQAQELIDLQKRKIEALEAQAEAAATKLNELRDPEKADDPAMRQRILDEVDRAMGIKNK